MRVWDQPPCFASRLGLHSDDEPQVKVEAWAKGEERGVPAPRGGEEERAAPDPCEKEVERAAPDPRGEEEERVVTREKEDARRLRPSWTESMVDAMRWRKLPLPGPDEDLANFTKVMGSAVPALIASLDSRSS